jgi:hypothetical protein
MFLFYSNLLMGEFTRTVGHGKSLVFGIEDIFSVTNFVNCRHFRPARLPSC